MSPSRIGRGRAIRARLVAFVAVALAGLALSASSLARAAEATTAPAPSAPNPAPSATPDATTGAPPSSAASAAALTSDARASAPSAPEGAPGHKDADAEAAAAAAESEAAARAVVEAAEQPYRLNLYGFADVGFTKPFAAGAQQLSPQYSTFAVGNLNLYLGSELGDNWRSLIEVRFTYLPNGSPSSTTTLGSQRIDTTVSDYTDLNRPVQWGGIVIERAWVERTIVPQLTVRAGQFLTPYGIWNVDHGSPVVIGVHRPYIVGAALFPASQTGLEIYGSTSVGSTDFGYHFTLSNGRGPVSTYQALDDNKAVGGRLFARNTSEIGTITLGGSFYRGKFTDRSSSFQATATSFGLVFPLTQQYDELSLGADLKWEYRGWLFQSEAILNDIAFNDSVRPQVSAGPGLPSGFSPDSRQWGVYGLLGYRTPFFGTMPWMSAEYYFASVPIFTKTADVSGGLNIRMTPRVVLKAQLTHAWFPHYEPIPGYPNLTTDINILDFQAAWSF